ncbi:HAMP domain-containing histidine kinase [Alkalicella caledoniensis]|uniref:histidine kinase n=1 Tax=Alkalicella caledoniensis TaxID=2731377 RepID=A0A7G9W6L4_ALKCA|nr:HAMP domain-containing sensor histidine kinase [Alkalicella caledoniensis]QNO14326.1 HAMP domain-containing histidine kinase [Alkalicella caledoniensis]
MEREIDNPELQTILFKIQAENDIFIASTRDFIPPYRPGREDFGSRNISLETITEVKEFTLQNGHTVSLTFYALVAPVNATITTIRYQLYFISGIMLLLAVSLALIIAKRVSKPIEEISQKAQTLAKGDYDTRFDGKGFFEIVALSDTLNTAAVELGRVEALRRELLANVSHDLRTPLSLIYSYAEMMNDFPDEITPEQTRVIMDETRRLTALVNDVLDISKLESDIERLAPSRFNLTLNIRETVERVQKLLKNESFDIAFAHNSDVYVNADETKIGRAFYNLLINAINYSGDSWNIEIMQTITENRVRISITDRGEGISEDDLPFIWDRYFKSGKKHKRPVIGTGLGLFIVKKIIELHGGEYGVTSEIDKGSTFWFELNIN